jgi:hypothetical protein
VQIAATQILSKKKSENKTRQIVRKNKSFIIIFSLFFQRLKFEIGIQNIAHFKSLAIR